MGTLVFQAALGGQVSVTGPNTASSYTIAVPTVNGTFVTTGDTGTVTNTMLASNAYTAPGAIGSVTPSTGAFTTLSASSTVSGAGFSNYLASPPAIGGTAPSTGKFTTLTSTSSVINGATSGSITLAVPAVAGSNTATLPAATGTVMVSGNMPAFSAYNSSNQNTTSTVLTKLIFNTKDFDTASAFDATTNYRFTPQVAGYYQINVTAFINGANTAVAIYLYKNGTAYQDLVNLPLSINGLTGSCLVYLNGLTDYLEIYGKQTGATGFYSTSPSLTRFSGSLVRAA